VLGGGVHVDPSAHSKSGIAQRLPGQEPAARGCLCNYACASSPLWPAGWAPLCRLLQFGLALLRCGVGSIRSSSYACGRLGSCYWLESGSDQLLLALRLRQLCCVDGDDEWLCRTPVVEETPLSYQSTPCLHYISRHAAAGFEGCAREGGG
jgi:hypothetical protein